jgi:hypothetical protein
MRWLRPAEAWRARAAGCCCSVPRKAATGCGHRTSAASLATRGAGRACAGSGSGVDRRLLLAPALGDRTTSSCRSRSTRPRDLRRLPARAYQHPPARRGHRRVLLLYAPVHVAEQAALLDQPSGGRIDLGVAERSPWVPMRSSAAIGGYARAETDTLITFLNHRSAAPNDQAQASSPSVSAGLPRGPVVRALAHRP